MASVNLHGVWTQTLSLLLCYSTACNLDLAGSLQGPGRGVEEGPGCCHSPLTSIYGLPFPPPRPTPGIKPASLESPALAGGFLTTAAPMPKILVCMLSR